MLKKQPENIRPKVNNPNVTGLRAVNILKWRLLVKNKKIGIKIGVKNMAQVTVSANLDEQDKINFDAFCSSVGMNMSTAINLFVKAVLRENRIPFEISATSDPFYSVENQAYVLKSVRELRENQGTPHELIEAEDE